MKFSIIWSVAKADTLERMRRFSYIVVCATSAFLAFMSVPNVKAPIVSIVMEPNIFAQGTNSTWVPIAIALCGGLLIAMIGLSFVNNNIKTDRNSGNLYIWQAMGMKKSSYILGKFLSNIILLTSIWLTVIIGAAIMTVIRFTGQNLQIYDFLTPFLGMYPSIIFASAIAIFLESTLGKKVSNLNTIGLCLFFVMFLINYLCSDSNNIILRILDFSNYRWIMSSINETVIAIIGRSVQETGILVPGGMFAESEGTKELIFHGLTLNDNYIIEKIGLIILCLGAVAASILFIDTKEDNIYQLKEKKVKKIKQKKDKYFGIFQNECKIIFLNKTKIWSMTILFLCLASTIINLEQAQNYIWIITVAISVSIFSVLGSKEHECRVTELFTTIQGALKRNTLYSYVIGVIYTFVISLPIIIRMILLFNGHKYYAYIAFALFIPALACLLGELTKSRRPFETLFLLFCFLLINKPDILFFNAVIICMFLGAGILMSITMLIRNKY